ncbi:MAG: NTPase [Candidatus Bathyarchaeota archaeon]|nr:MAG: NTPase [Candidatus Bathyarchaeota archaeon]
MERKKDTAKRVILVTGRPRTGKTTILLRAANELIMKGYKLGGMVSREIIQGGVRVGFQLVDFGSGERGWLARVGGSSGPKIGKYKVNLTDLELIGAKAIMHAKEGADIVLVDEIGPMELLSEAFRLAVKDVIDGEKPVLGTIHHRAQHTLIQTIKLRGDTEIIEVTPINRTEIPRVIVDKINRFFA